MKRVLVAVALGALALSSAAATRELIPSSPSPRVILGGEAVDIRDDGVRFTTTQVRDTSAATRAGLVRWSKTRQGKTILRYLAEHSCAVTVVEDADEPSIGVAPQPGIATLASRLHSEERRQFVVVLNPAIFKVPEGASLLPGEPANAGEMMAVGWAAEMLHVYFYAQGISLPHHRRDDFQKLWLASAAELGFPQMKHGGEEEAGPGARVVVIGEDPTRPARPQQPLPPLPSHPH